MNKPVQPSRANNCRIKNIFPVCRSYYFYISKSRKTINLSKKLHESSLHLPLSRSSYINSLRSERINLVYENNCRSSRFSESKNFLNEFCTFTNKFLNKLRSYHFNESRISFCCNCFCN